MLVCRLAKQRCLQKRGGFFFFFCLWFTASSKKCWFLNLLLKLVLSLGFLCIYQQHKFSGNGAKSSSLLSYVALTCFGGKCSNFFPKILPNVFGSDYVCKTIEVTYNFVA